MTLIRLIACFIVLTTVGAAAQARTVYVDDTLYAPIRSGQGNQFRILHQGVRSGTPLELLETTDEGYSRVRTKDGIEGWIPTRYISETPIARDRLAEAQRQLERTREELNTVKGQLVEVTRERDQLENSEDTLENRTSELNQELQRIKSIASDSLQLDQRNQELREENQKLKNDLEVLTAEKERLEARKESDFMLLGAGLVLAGVLLALVVPMLKPSRKTDNWA